MCLYRCWHNAQRLRRRKNPFIKTTEFLVFNFVSSTRQSVFSKSRWIFPRLLCTFSDVCRGKHKSRSGKNAPGVIQTQTRQNIGSAGCERSQHVFMCFSTHTLTTCSRYGFLCNHCIKGDLQSVKCPGVPAALWFYSSCTPHTHTSTSYPLGRSFNFDSTDLMAMGIG